ncbi:octapeptide-repeat protein T2 [Gracilaria domingensis]|nr:octapeptide-repeat protein T2 [Gracilaria domingensis]
MPTPAETPPAEFATRTSTAHKSRASHRRGSRTYERGGEKLGRRFEAQLVHVLRVQIIVPAAALRARKRAGEERRNAVSGSKWTQDADGGSTYALCHASGVKRARAGGAGKLASGGLHLIAARTADRRGRARGESGREGERRGRRRRRRGRGRGRAQLTAGADMAKECRRRDQQQQAGGAGRHNAREPR